MGFLHRWPLGKIREQYGLVNFVETGTWKGDGILYAMKAPFESLWSVELQYKLREAACNRVYEVHPDDERWRIMLGDSVNFVKVVTPFLEGPTLWWLDAHLPERYGEAGGATKLPLEAEITSIVGAERDHSKDVFILDDWRLYESGPYANGPFIHQRNGGPEAKRGPLGNPDHLLALLSLTHIVTKDYRDEGYLVATPK